VARHRVNGCGEMNNPLLSTFGPPRLFEASLSVNEAELY
jgi:hypothetical protein